MSPPVVEGDADPSAGAGLSWLPLDELRRLGLVGGITLRVPGLAVPFDREEALAALAATHAAAARHLAPGRTLVTASQSHGARVAVVEEIPPLPLDDTDALVTARRDVILGVAVADCCPVWLAAAESGVFGLVHVGRAGVEKGVVPSALETLCEVADVEPGAVRAFLGPCIRPPDYEVDLPAGIRGQLAAAGVREVGDCGLNTAADPERFYSYRREKGKTGRMMALATRM